MPTSVLPLLSSTIYILLRSFSGVDARAVNTTTSSLPTSDISSSILAGSVNATASSQRCGDIDNCRTLGSIVQSCLVTILACVWFAVHRNIPAPQPIRPHHPNFFVRCAKWVWRTVLDQKDAAKVFIVALLVPEWILAWAVRQSIVAWRLIGKLEAARSMAEEKQKARCLEILDLKKDEASLAASADGQASMDGSAAAHTDSEETHVIKRRSATDHALCQICEGRGNQCDRVAAKKRVAKGDECWTWSHGFLVVMGGFHFYNKDGPLYPLSPNHVVELVTRGHLVPPTAEEIADRSKGDALSKGVAIGQTGWFVLQCIARRAEHLPITRLEVMTLAYTVMIVAMYAAWWAKPLNVSCAIRVPEEEVKARKVYTHPFDRMLAYVAGAQDSHVDLRRCTQVPTFWAGIAEEDDITIADVIAVLVAMAFGAVHCIAWNFEFQSHLEQMLWRSAAITNIAIPLPAVPFLFVGRLLAGIEDNDINGGLIIIIAFLTISMSFVYIAARIILITLSFTSLRALPFAEYQTVQWTTFVPHI